MRDTAKTIVFVCALVTIFALSPFVVREAFHSAVLEAQEPKIPPAPSPGVEPVRHPLPPALATETLEGYLDKNGNPCPKPEAAMSLIPEPEKPDDGTFTLLTVEETYSSTLTIGTDPQIVISEGKIRFVVKGKDVLVLTGDKPADEALAYLALRGWLLEAARNR